MIVYRLNIFQDEDEIDQDEFFASLRAATLRRRELIDAGCAKEFGDFAIDRLKLVDMPKSKLVLAVLNGTGFVSDTTRVMDEYVPKKKEAQRHE